MLLILKPNGCPCDVDLRCLEEKKNSERETPLKIFSREKHKDKSIFLSTMGEDELEA